MIKNYFKLAFRNLIKNKTTSFFHIFGLTLSLAGSLLIGLFVFDELQYDSFHPDGERSYRIYSERGGANEGARWAGTSPALGPTLKRDFPEVEKNLRMFLIRSKQLFTKGDQSFLEEKGFFAEPSIFEFFHLPLKYGDPETALEEINSIVLSHELAQKYFGDRNSLGEQILINKEERVITGVLEPMSQHFHLEFDFLVSFKNLLAQVSEERINSWIWQDFSNYIKLRPKTDLISFEEKLDGFVEHYAHPLTKERGFYYYLKLQKLEDIYLHSAHITNDLARKGSYQYVWGLLVVGLFLLFISCVNFINLTTAKAVRRAKEVGVRKVVGARRHELAVQFVSEAIFIVVISMLLATQITSLALPYLNAFTGKSITFDWYSNPAILATLTGMSLATGLFAGLYPAFIMSGFRPVEALKGSSFRPSGHITWLRKGLLTLQFAISTLLIISVLVIYQQVKYLGHKDLGFAKEQLLHFPMKNNLYKNFDNTKAQFMMVPGVTSASTCFGIPGDIIAGDDVIVPGSESASLPARIFAVDHNYVQTMGMELVAGRGFSEDIGSDANEAFIINETAVRDLGLADSPEGAIGQPLHWEGWDDENTMKRGRVIGVVKDFHYRSLHEEVQSAVLHIYPDSYWKLALRVEAGEINQSIAGIQRVWAEFDTGYPLDYQFVDEGFGAMYEAESKLNSLFWIFTLLAILISCIGAFGLAAYEAEQRRKEIGIRKVLGASVGAIVGLLSKDFLRLVCLAFVIASPVAWYFMDGWLENFAYRINIEWWVFLLAAMAVIAIAFLTVSFQSIKAALANPILSLRNE